MKPRATNGSDTRETRRLATLLDVSQALSGTLNLKSALHRVLEILAKHHGAVRSMVTFLAEDGELTVEASDGLEEPQTVRYRIGEGITGRVVAEQQAGRRPAREPRTGASSSRRAPIRAAREELSFVCVPILVNRKAAGALGVDLRFKPERDFDRSVKFLGVVASMIAQALKVQRLVEDERRRLLAENTHLRQELRERYDFSNIIGTSGPMRADVRAGGAGGRHQHDGADPRRVGHRQGADRARDPLQLAARQEAVRQGELRGAAREPDRVRAVRLREGRVHRRADAGRKADSSSPRAARCSSTRSATSTSRRR